MSRFVFALFFVCVLPARAETLDAMDQVTREAGSLDAFLASPSLQDRYFGAMKAYFKSDRVTRAVYDGMLDQLRKLVTEVPELKARLWETEGIGQPFSIALSATSYGRRLDDKVWQASLRELDSRLAADAASYRNDRGAAAKIKALLADFEKRAAAANREGQAAAREFFIQAKKDPGLRGALAHLLRERLASEAVQDQLRSGDANLVLRTLDNLRNNARELFAASGIHLGPATSLLQGLLPSTGDLLANEAAFPREMRTAPNGSLVPVGKSGVTTFHFNPLPRRFHGLWKGLPLGECVGSSTAQRWATVAIAGTQFYHVERESTDAAGTTVHYEGFTQHVPLRGPGGRVVGSTDLGSPALNRLVAWPVPQLDDPLKVPLYDLWLGEMKKRLPGQWQGLALSEATHVDNAGVKATARGDSSYFDGRDLGNSRRWRITDPLAKRIVGATVPDSYGYSGDMIFDARGRDEPLRLLGETLTEKIARDFLAPDRAIMNGNWLFRKMAVIERLRKFSRLGERQMLQLLGAPNVNEVAKVAEAYREGKKAPTSRLGNLFASGVALGTAFAAIAWATALQTNDPKAYILAVGTLPILGAGAAIFSNRQRALENIGKIYRARLAEAQAVEAERTARGRPARLLGPGCRAGLRTLF